MHTETTRLPPAIDSVQAARKAGSSGAFGTRSPPGTTTVPIERIVSMLPCTARSVPMEVCTGRPDRER